MSKLYEKQFLREMVKQMRGTVGESSFMPAGFAEKYYREQLDEQYVESWGDSGGIGLGKMIYDQLIFRYGEMLGIKVPQNKPMGPLPLSQRDQWGARIEAKDQSIVFVKKDETSKIESSNSKNSILDSEKNNDSPASINDKLHSENSMIESKTKKNTASNLESPWSGRWLGSFELESGIKVAKIQHEGFQSILVGNFKASSFKVGDIVKEGDTVGVLAPEAKQLNWKFQKTEN